MKEKVTFSQTNLIGKVLKKLGRFILLYKFSNQDKNNVMFLDRK